MIQNRNNCKYTCISNTRELNRMSEDTFEFKTFSKTMGEDSEGETSQEDFDEMIMNINYFQKQNKSSEPSVIHDPLMLDHTTMNENTIMLIRIIEANLNAKIIQESESKARNNISHQCHDTVPASNKNTIELMKAQQIEETKLNNNKLGINLMNQSDANFSHQHHDIVSTSDKNRFEFVKGQQKVNLNVYEPRKNLETQLSSFDNTTKLQQKNMSQQPVGVEIVHKRKKMKLHNSKSFWSPGNAQSSSEGGTQFVSEKHDKLSEIPIKQNQNHAKQVNSQNNSDKETSTKDVKQYKSRALPKLEKPLQSQNNSSSVTQSTSQQVTKMKDSMMKKESIIESDKKKGINEKQKEPSDKMETEIKIPETIIVKNNLGIKSNQSKANETLVTHPSGNEICQQQKDYIEKVCKTCDKYFKAYSGLVFHRIAKHGYPKDSMSINTWKPITCEDCHEVKFSSEDLMRHRKKEHSENFCEICDRYFPLNAGLVSHKLAKHGYPDDSLSIIESKSINCEDCHDALYVEFSSEEELISHRKKEHTEKMCEICDKYFPLHAGLVSHRRAKHGYSKDSLSIDKWKPITCEECHEVKFSSEDLMRHRKKEHTENFCEICDRYFPLNDGLVFHRKAKHSYSEDSLSINKLKSMNCEDCHDALYVKFSSEEELMCHRKKEHTEKFCEICDKYFSVFSGLVIHRIAKHGYPEDQPEDSLSIDKLKSMTCEDCHDMKFSSEEELMCHRKKEHREKFCEICDRYFPLNDGLVSHRTAKHGHPEDSLSINNLKSMTCDDCHLLFSLKEELMCHRKEMHPEKYCEICNWYFISVNDETSHKKTIHGQ